MPKYVFEQGVILPADEELSALELIALSEVLAEEVRRWLRLMHHERHEVNAEDPFEHVYGNDSQPIDLDDPA